jgi:hypothetical protein
MSLKIRMGLALAALLFSLPAAAGEVAKSFTFELDKWFDLASTDGPVTIHRLRLERVGGGFTKLARLGGSSDYAASVELQIEYTNDASSDWKADVVVEWLDAKGEVIDGYRSDMNLDEDDRHELKKSTITTLRYGLDQARKLRVEIRTNPD